MDLSGQCKPVRGQQRPEGVACEIGVLNLPDAGEWIEAGQYVVDKAGMAHHEAALWQPIQKSGHQGAEIRRTRMVIGAGESRIVVEARAFSAAPERRRQLVRSEERR